MADLMLFTEGADYLNANGWPATVYFMLSTRYVAATGTGSTQHAAADTLAGTGHGGEITGTAYARVSQARPTSASGVMAFTLMSWATNTATDWPANTCSLVAVTSSDNLGKMLCAWDLQDGGAVRDLSPAGTTEVVTPSFALPTGP